MFFQFSWTKYRFHIVSNGITMSISNTLTKLTIGKDVIYQSWSEHITDLKEKLGKRTPRNLTDSFQFVDRLTGSRKKSLKTLFIISLSNAKFIRSFESCATLGRFPFFLPRDASAVRRAQHFVSTEIDNSSIGFVGDEWSNCSFE